MSGSEFRGKFVQDARIAEEVAAWKANRLAYPGWVVLPQANRRRLWDHTRSWSELILARCQEQELPSALSWLAELTWRVRLSFIPMTQQHAHLLDWVTSSIVPDSRLANVTSRLHPGMHLDATVNWSQITADWIEVSSALLCYRREQRDQESFNAIREKIRLVEGLADFAAYETCLMGLEIPDQVIVRKEVDAWIPQNLIWTLRKAAVLIELGDGREGYRLASEVVEGARRHCGHDQGRYEAMSLEGWALQLAWATGSASNTSSKPRETPPQRWHELARYKCDPFAELDPIRDALRVICGRLEGHDRVSPTADSENDEIIGFTAARMCEDAAQPTSYHTNAGFSHYELSKQILKHAAIALDPNNPRRALSLLFRAGDGGSIKKVFDDHRVAALSDKDAADFFASACDVLYSHRIFQPHNDQQALVAALHVAAQLVCRAKPNDVADLAKCSIALFGNPDPTRLGKIREGESRVLAACLLATPRENRSELTLPILGLPLLGCDPIPGHAALENDVSIMLLGYEVPKGQKPSATDIAAVTTRLLTGIVEGGVVQARALLRIAIMQRHGLLSLEAARVVTDEIWKHSHGGNWPRVQGVPDWVIANLPEVQPGAAETGFRRQCTTRSFPSLFVEVDGGDGVRRRGVGGSNPENDPLDNAWRATIPPWDLGDNVGFLHVSWSMLEVRDLLGHAICWWQVEGRDLAKRRNLGRGFQPETRLRLLAEFVAYAALPIADLPLETLTAVSELLEEANAEGCLIDIAWPLLAKLGPDGERRATRHLRKALASGKRTRSQPAAFATVAWLEAAANGVMVQPPSDLIDSLAHEVKMREPAILPAALFFLKRMIQLRRLSAVGNLLEDIAVGLEYLLEDTRYRVRSEPDGAVPYAEVPQIREHAAALAGTLTGLSVLEPDLAAQWRIIGETDPLPLVRQAYQEGIISGRSLSCESEDGVG